MALAALILLTCLIVFSTFKTRKLPESISETAYIIPRWLFTILMMVFGLLVMPGIISVVGIGYEWLSILVVFGLWCVAASPYYKTEQVKMHYIGAAICFASALFVIILVNPLLLLIWLLYPLCLLRKTRKWWLMVAECLCFLELIWLIF